jgi:hypothetical protein
MLITLLLLVVALVVEQALLLTTQVAVAEAVDTGLLLEHLVVALLRNLLYYLL